MPRRSHTRLRVAHGARSSSSRPATSPDGQELHRDADDVVPGLDEQSGGHRGVDAAAHRHEDAGHVGSSAYRSQASVVVGLVLVGVRIEVRVRAT